MKLICTLCEFAKLAGAALLWHRAGAGGSGAGVCAAGALGCEGGKQLGGT